MHRPLAGMVICAALACAGCGDDGAPAPSQAGTWKSLAPAMLARTEVAAARVGRFV